MIAAIVPAAGRSERMGRPKLLLPLQGQTLIARVVTALRAGGADLVVVVAPPEDSDEGPAVAQAARGAGAFVVAPTERPAEMRDSIEIGLATIAKFTPPDHLMFAPETPRASHHGSSPWWSKRARASRRRSWCHSAATPRAPAGSAVEARR